MNIAVDVRVILKDEEEEEEEELELYDLSALYKLFKALYSHMYRAYRGKKGETEYGYSHPGSCTCPHGTDILRPHPSDEARKIVSLLKHTPHPAQWLVHEPGTHSSNVRASTTELSRLPRP